MKKFVSFGFALLLVLFLGIGFVSVPKASASATETNQQVVILDKNFASGIESLNKYGIAETQVSNITPVDAAGYQRLDGASFVPTLVGDGENNYIDCSVNVDERVAELDATQYNLNEMALQLWIKINLKPDEITRGLTIQLSSENGSNKITWVISQTDLKALSTRSSLSSYDQKIFGNNVNNAITGWVKLNCPISTGVVSGSLTEGNKFTFNKFNIKQTTEKASDVALAIYDVRIVSEDDEAKDVITSSINDFCSVLLKPSAKVVSENDEFYMGEIFPQFLATKSVYSSLFVGDEDYLDGTHSADLKIRVDTGLSGDSLAYFSYGSYNFKLSRHNYNISYGFYYNGKFVSVLADNIIVDDYGKGVWFEDSGYSFKVGEQKKISYTVHKAFKNATLNFKSTNEEVLKIVEVNKASRYIIVECVKTGNAGIDILIEDARLEGTEYEDTGIKNEDFKVKVVKADKKVDTTKVLLWVALGLLLSGLVYLAVKAIIDAKKIEIK